MAGETIPDYQPDGDRYTWAKAPRYGEKVVQTGPLAELLIGGEALIASLQANEGGNAWLRQFARMRRIAQESSVRDKCSMNSAEHVGEPHLLKPRKLRRPMAEGYGLTMAARGASAIGSNQGRRH